MLCLALSMVAVVMVVGVNCVVFDGGLVLW